jgi:hypothetical protein
MPEHNNKGNSSNNNKNKGKSNSSNSAEDAVSLLGPVSRCGVVVHSLVVMKKDAARYLAVCLA